MYILFILLFFAHLSYAMDYKDCKYQINPKFYLEKYLATLQEEKLLHYLKQESIKNYITSEKQLLLWALGKTDNPRMIKHLIDHDIIIDNQSEAYIFHKIAENPYFHDKKLITALIKRYATLREKKRLLEILQHKKKCASQQLQQKVDFIKKSYHNPFKKNKKDSDDKKDFLQEIINKQEFTAFEKAYITEMFYFMKYNKPFYSIDPSLEIYLMSKDPHYLNVVESIINYHNGIESTKTVASGKKASKTINLLNPERLLEKYDSIKKHNNDVRSISINNIASLFMQVSTKNKNSHQKTNNRDDTPSIIRFSIIKKWLHTSLEKGITEESHSDANSEESSETNI